VPTVTCKVLFVFVVLVHDRRRAVHINVTDAPTAQWTAQQLVEAFPWETAPRYLLRDRDGLYGAEFSSRVQSIGIGEVKPAPRSPWQNPYVERLIGTLRRECLDHGVVQNETHLRHLLRDYLTYYHRCRTHLSLEKDTPEPRLVERPDQGGIVEMPMVGGLHHQYTRRAAYDPAGLLSVPADGSWRSVDSPRGARSSSTLGVKSARTTLVLLGVLRCRGPGRQTNGLRRSSGYLDGLSGRDRLSDAFPSSIPQNQPEPGRRSRSAAKRRGPKGLPRIDFPIPDTVKGWTLTSRRAGGGADAPFAFVAPAWKLPRGP
jgi:putative transposase